MPTETNDLKPGVVTEDGPYLCEDCGTTWPSFAAFTRKDREHSLARIARTAARRSNPDTTAEDDAARRPTRTAAQSAVYDAMARDQFATEKQVEWIMRLGDEFTGIAT